MSYLYTIFCANTKRVLHVRVLSASITAIPENGIIITLTATALRRSLQHQFYGWCLSGTMPLARTCYMTGWPLQQYSNFLESVLPRVLEDVPLAARKIVQFQQNRASVNDALDGRESSNATKPGMWVARRELSPWISRSPDLNLMHAFSCHDTWHSAFNQSFPTTQTIWWQVFK